ncbi:pyocin activator PrtN family protein [Dyella marensis]|uniref:pyocin activator PrtN family protein n=1 Tax=Dyella marensis TaxID=500610 RepID=UPI003C2BD12C
MNTLFSLLAQYETAQIPLDRCCHLFGLKPDEAAKRAGRHALPIPAFRIGTQKSPWLVDAKTLADHLDRFRDEARVEWSKIKGHG